MWHKIKTALWLVVGVFALLGWGMALGVTSALLVVEDIFVLANIMSLPWFATVLLTTYVAILVYDSVKDAIQTYAP